MKYTELVEQYIEKNFPKPNYSSDWSDWIAFSWPGAASGKFGEWAITQKPITLTFPF